MLLPGVAVSVWLIVAMPVGAATETPPALTIDSVQFVPWTATITSFGLKASGPATRYAPGGDVPTDAALSSGAGVDSELEPP